jgi:hypothetical protein
MLTHPGIRQGRGLLLGCTLRTARCKSSCYGRCLQAETIVLIPARTGYYIIASVRLWPIPVDPTKLSATITAPSPCIQPLCAHSTTSAFRISIWGSTLWRRLECSRRSACNTQMRRKHTRRASSKRSEVVLEAKVEWRGASLVMRFGGR